MYSHVLGKTAERVRTVFAAAALTLFIVLIFINFSAVREGVFTGMSAAATRVIPSLFVFSVISSLAVGTGVIGRVAKRFSAVTRAVFGLSGDAATVFFISLFSGFTVGAIMTDRLYRRGEVSRETAERLAALSVNAGPVFVIFTVGDLVLESRSDGVRLFVSLTAASVILAAVTGQFSKKKRGKCDVVKSYKSADVPPNVAFDFTDELVNAVVSSGNAMVKMTFFIAFFSGFGAVLRSVSLPFADLVCGLVEVTVGVSHFGRGELPLIAFFLGFSGISVIFQVRAISASFRPRLWVLVLLRAVNGLLAALLTAAADLFFPRAVETALLVGEPSQKVFGGFSGSVAAGFSLWLFAVVLFSAATESRMSLRDKLGLHNME